MSNFAFPATSSTPQTKNPNNDNHHNHPHHHQTSNNTACMMDGYDHDDHHHDHQDFDLSSYLALLDDQLHEEDHHHPVSRFNSTESFSQSWVPQERSSGSSSNSINNVTRVNQMQMLNEKSRSGLKRAKMDVGCKVAFRTKSDLEIMDDGFKWRKYGKKMVKNSPNPRNYYKCSSEGCNVKKRVERDPEDASYVITTYEGIHSHESPSVIYCNEMPLTFPSNGWTLQASSASS